MKSRNGSGHVLLLASELSLILCLVWALAWEPGQHHTTPHPRLPSACCCPQLLVHPPHRKEEPMKHAGLTAAEPHVDVHINLCPDHRYHLQIGNVCLHLCLQDFRRLAQAVREAAELNSPTGATTASAKEGGH